MYHKKILAIVVVCIVTIAFSLTGCQSKGEKYTSDLLACAEKYGVKNVTVDVPELRNGYTDYIHVYISDIKELEWSTLFELSSELDALVGSDSVVIMDKVDNSDVRYSFYGNTNQIVEYVKDSVITYSGSWDSFAVEDSATHSGNVSQGIKEVRQDNLDSLIGSEKCEVCGKESTKRIDAEFYCDEHYDDAMEYYKEQSTKK